MYGQIPSFHTASTTSEVPDVLYEYKSVYRGVIVVLQVQSNLIY